MMLMIRKKILGKYGDSPITISKVLKYVVKKTRRDEAKKPTEIHLSNTCDFMSLLFSLLSDVSIAVK